MAAINTEYYSNLKKQIEGCSSCEKLREIKLSALQEIADQQASIAAQIAALQPILALVTPPTNLNGLISWISNFITAFIRPMIKPYTLYQEQLIELSVQLADITAALQSASVKFPDCSL